MIQKPVIETMYSELDRVNMARGTCPRCGWTTDWFRAVTIEDARAKVPDRCKFWEDHQAVDEAAEARNRG